MIALIVAVSRNGVIGHEGRIPWHLPEDLARFKKLTTGNVLVMGRLTYDSIGRPLPGRRTIIVTSIPLAYEGLYPTLSAAKTILQALRMASPTEDVFIAGGARLYTEALSIGCVERVYLTEVHRDVEGDVRYQPDLGRFAEVERDDTAECSFVTYNRVR